MSVLGRATGKRTSWVNYTSRGQSTVPIASQLQGAPVYRKASQRLPSFPARTRFAPSPTGYLHLGSLRTALFNYLVAKATGGQFLLRIEDTDKKRTVSGAEERICRDLQWAGLQWDEGPEIEGPCGPYRQSARTDLYVKHANKLLDLGHAYRCFCTSDRLSELAQQRSQLGLPTDYDRTCEGIPLAESDDRAYRGEMHVVRLRVPDIYPKYNDLVYGSVGNPARRSLVFKHGEPAYEDPILLKSDGLPTYHLANVIDDHLMDITHVIRGVEWMPSTPKHLIIYKAFGWQPPLFAHVGLLLDENRQKLSKRNLDIDILKFKKDGIFPEALVNYVALLGWSHSLGTDFIPLKDLMQNFDLKFTKGNTILNLGKLNYLQRRYAAEYAKEDGANFQKMVDEVLACVEDTRKDRIDLDIIDGRDMKQYVAAVVRLDAKQYVSAKDFVLRNRFFFVPVEQTNPHSNGDFPDWKLNEEQDIRTMASVACQLKNVPLSNWTSSHLKEEATGIVDKICRTNYERHLPDGEKKHSPMSVKEATGLFNRWLRSSIMGGLPGPSMLDTMALLGREVTLGRLYGGGKYLSEGVHV